MKSFDEGLSRYPARYLRVYKFKSCQGCGFKLKSRVRLQGSRIELSGLHHTGLFEGIFERRQTRLLTLGAWETSHS